MPPPQPAGPRSHGFAAGEDGRSAPPAPASPSAARRVSHWRSVTAETPIAQAIWCGVAPAGRRDTINARIFGVVLAVWCMAHGCPLKIVTLRKHHNPQVQPVNNLLRRYRQSLSGFDGNMPIEKRVRALARGSDP